MKNRAVTAQRDLRTGRSVVVMGHGGNGITFIGIAAQVIQRAILGLPDPDADLFALPR